MKRVFAALVLMLLPMAVSAAPIDTVVAALDAAGAAPIERTRLFIERNGVADVYYIDRVRPGRLRMLKNPNQGGLELVVVDGMQWLRTAGGWQKSPVPMTADLVPPLTGLFRNGLTDAVEQPRPDGGSSVEGHITWTNGAYCDGSITLQISAVGLPSLLSFKGACGGKPSRFHQAFSYDGPLIISPPE